MRAGAPVIAHLTTVDLSLRYLLLPQLEAPLSMGIESVGISAPGPWVDDLERRGIRHIALLSSTRGMSLGGDLRAAWDLYRILRRLRPEILHTHNPKPGIYGRIVGRRAGVPIVVNTVHGLYAAPDDRWAKRAMVYGLEAIASRLSHLELVQSAEDAALMRRLRIAPRHRVVRLGNGIDLTRFDPDALGSQTRRQVREELGLSDGQIAVGMVGRLVREKGYPELFQAARLVDSQFVFICIGPEDTEKEDALSGEMIEAARAAGIRFLGMRTDVERLYAAMDVFVLPSHREGFPRAAMEAAAMGLPVVATDIRGCREVVADGRNGLLVPVQDPGGLAAALEQLRDPNVRSRMSQQAREIARERFDERNVVATVLANYARLARMEGRQELAAALSGKLPPGAPVVRRAVAIDAAFLASLHMHAIATGFLPSLGRRFLAVLYRALVDDPNGVVLVAEDGSGPVGFVAGSRSTSSFYRSFLRRHGGRALLAAGWRLFRPSTLRRAYESLRYGGEDSAAGAELLSMAVVPERRGRGIGQALGRELIGQLGPEPIRVVVGAGNREAIAAYRKMGFQPWGQVEVHRGELSEVLQWSDR